MNRRHFLSALAAAVAGATLDPERLLWIPGQRTYFDQHVPNVFDTADFVWGNESIFEFNTLVIRHVDGGLVALKGRRGPVIAVFHPPIPLSASPTGVLSVVYPERTA